MLTIGSTLFTKHTKICVYLIIVHLHKKDIRMYEMLHDCNSVKENKKLQNNKYAHKYNPRVSVVNMQACCVAKLIKYMKYTKHTFLLTQSPHENLH